MVFWIFTGPQEAFFGGSTRFAVPSPEYECVASRRHNNHGREVFDVSRYQSLEALSKSFDEHIGDWALARATLTLFLYVLSPKVKCIESVPTSPGLKPLHPYPLEKLRLQARIAVELWRQLDVGNRTEDQSIWQVTHQTLGGSEPKLRIILANIEEDRGINDPSHGTLAFPFPQFGKNLIAAALRKSMLARKVQSTHRIGFNGCARLDNETTFSSRDFLPDNGLTGL